MGVSSHSPVVSCVTSDHSFSSKLFLKEATFSCSFYPVQERRPGTFHLSGRKEGRSCIAGMVLFTVAGSAKALYQRPFPSCLFLEWCMPKSPCCKCFHQKEILLFLIFFKKLEVGNISHGDEMLRGKCAWSFVHSPDPILPNWLPPLKVKGRLFWFEPFRSMGTEYLLSLATLSGTLSIIPFA